MMDVCSITDNGSFLPHDWQPSEWRLVTVSKRHAFEVIDKPGPRVDVCRRCGATRVREEDR